MFGHEKFVPEKAPSQQEVAQAAQDPNHPANPQHKDHSAWVKSMAGKFGNAVVWGAGATFGSDMINSMLGR